MIHEDMQYKVVYASGKESTIMGVFLKSMLRENCNIVSYTLIK